MKNKLKFKLDIQTFAAATDVFVPTLWSARLLAHLDKNLVFKSFYNNDYEGEISDYGDTVKINQIGNIAIKDYTGADISDAEDVTGEQQTLVIDQGKYFNFRVKDVLAAQANVTLVDKAMERAAYALADIMDQDLAKVAADKAGIKVGTIAEPVVITVANAYDKLVDLGVSFNEKNVSKAERKIALPAWYIGMLSKDPRFTKDFKIIENGVVEGAKVGTFQVYESNNLPVDETDESIYRAVAMAPEGGQFANQISKTETYRPEKNFADAVKGLSLYGRDIIQKSAVAEFVIKQGV